MLNPKNGLRFKPEAVFWNKVLPVPAFFRVGQFLPTFFLQKIIQSIGNKLDPGPYDHLQPVFSNPNDAQGAGAPDSCIVCQRRIPDLCP